MKPKEILYTLVGAAAVFSGAASTRADLIDDFNDGDLVGWTFVDTTSEQVGSASADGGFLRLFSSDSVDPGQGNFLAYNDSYSGDNAYVDGVFRMTLRTANELTTVGMFMRSTASDESLYLMFLVWYPEPYNVGSLIFNTIEGGKLSRVEYVDLPEIALGDSWNLEVSALGTEFALKAWPSDDTEPAEPQLFVTDTTLPDGGFGLFTTTIIDDISEPQFLNAQFDDLEYEAPAPPCDGDANGDGTVDPLDDGFVKARLACPVGAGDPNCDAADANSDGVVDPLDIGFVQARFGECD